MGNETNTVRDWKPVKKGATYCSPACGAGCTHEAFEVATRKAKALVERCEKEIGGSWEADVSENLGWHWSVHQKKSNINIRCYEGKINSNGDVFAVGLNGGTPAQVSLHPRGFKTPKEAFDAQIKAIQNEVDGWLKILNNAKSK